jgi:hypothetical protein
MRLAAFYRERAPHGPTKLLVQFTGTDYGVVRGKANAKFRLPQSIEQMKSRK